jgi:hypothetical protein
LAISVLTPPAFFGFSTMTPASSLHAHATQPIHACGGFLDVERPIRKIFERHVSSLAGCGNELAADERRSTPINADSKQGALSALICVHLRL